MSRRRQQAAVAGELDHVLAGVAVWCADTRCRGRDRALRRRRWNTASMATRGRSIRKPSTTRAATRTRRPADPDHGHRRASGRRREGGDGIGEHGGKLPCRDVGRCRGIPPTEGPPSARSLDACVRRRGPATLLPARQRPPCQPAATGSTVALPIPPRCRSSSPRRPRHRGGDAQRPCPIASRSRRLAQRAGLVDRRRPELGLKATGMRTRSRPFASIRSGSVTC